MTGRATRRASVRCSPVVRLSVGAPVALDLVQVEPLHPAAHQCAAMPARLLRKPVANLVADQGVLRDALEAVISGV